MGKERLFKNRGGLYISHPGILYFSLMFPGGFNREEYLLWG
jgi:hypothetical protein